MRDPDRRVRIRAACETLDLHRMMTAAHRALIATDEAHADERTRTEQ